MSYAKWRPFSLGLNVLTPGAWHQHCVNSLSPRRCGSDFKYMNFKDNLGIDILSAQVNIITLEWTGRGAVVDLRARRKSSLFWG